MVAKVLGLGAFEHEVGISASSLGSVSSSDADDDGRMSSSVASALRSIAIGDVALLAVV